MMISSSITPITNIFLNYWTWLNHFLFTNLCLLHSIYLLCQWTQRTTALFLDELNVTWKKLHWSSFLLTFQMLTIKQRNQHYFMFDLFSLKPLAHAQMGARSTIAILIFCCWVDYNIFEFRCVWNIMSRWELMRINYHTYYNVQLQELIHIIRQCFT